MRPLCTVDNHQKTAKIPNAKLQIDHVADSRDIVMMSMDVQKEEIMGSWCEAIKSGNPRVIQNAMLTAINDGPEHIIEAIMQHARGSRERRKDEVVQITISYVY
jgi:hypothetical protein